MLEHYCAVHTKSASASQGGRSSVRETAPGRLDYTCALVANMRKLLRGRPVGLIEGSP